MPNMKEQGYREEFKQADITHMSLSDMPGIWIDKEQAQGLQSVGKGKTKMIYFDDLLELLS